jgi:hypothetical protein
MVIAGEAMRRLLPLLVFGLLPGAVAAPVPPGERAEFGTNGLLSRADLEKVKFDTQPAKREDGRDWPEEAIAAEKRERDEQKLLKPAGPRPANRYDLAVHMPWTKFREGEPVPAYFVLRNNRSAMLGLGSRMDLSGGYPELHGGGMSLDVRDRATGKSVLKGLCASTNCGGGSLVDVPGDGFYCLKGDLARVAGGLAPGEYEVDWRCGRLASAPVRFTVAKGDGAKPAAPAKRTNTLFFHLTPGEDGDERPERPGEPFLRADCCATSLYTQSMVSALAVGPNGVYVPDVRAIPVADKLVEAWIEWKPYRDGDRVAVTLRAVPPHKQVRFEELPQLFLQVETADRDYLGARDSEAEKARERGDDQLLVTPLTIEVGLPKDWRDRIGADGTAQVSVLVAAKPIEMPRGRAERLMKRAEVEVRRDRPGEDRPIWGGLVRTEFVELRFPPPLPAVQR